MAISRVSGQTDVTFDTMLGIEEVADFYREALEGAGLEEDLEHSNDEASAISLIFTGDSVRKRAVVQAVDFKNQGADRRAVSVRFE